MAISLRAAGTATAATAAVTAVNPAVPAGAIAGDLSVLTVWMKPFGTTITTPSGWTKIGEATNGTTAAGTDTGSTKVAVFVKVSAAVGAIGNLTLAGSPNSVGAVINVYRNNTGSWDFSQFTTGGDSTNAANYSATGAAGISVSAGDWVCGSTAVNGDVGTQTVTTIGGMSGATLGTTVRRQTADTTTGTDSHGEIADVPISAGSSTAAPTFTYTNASSGSGTTLWLRLREAPSVPNTGSALSLGANLLTSDQATGGDISKTAVAFSTVGAGGVTLAYSTNQRYRDAGSISAICDGSVTSQGISTTIPAGTLLANTSYVLTMCVQATVTGTYLFSSVNGWRGTVFANNQSVTAGQWYTFRAEFLNVTANEAGQTTTMTVNTTASVATTIYVDELSVVNSLGANLLTVEQANGTEAAGTPEWLSHTIGTTFSSSTDFAKSGTRSVKTVQTTAGRASYSTLPSTVITPGNVYTVIANIRAAVGNNATDNQGFTVALYWFTSADVAIIETYSASFTINSSDWTVGRITAVAPPTAGKVRILIYSDPLRVASATYYIDECLIAAGHEGTVRIGTASGEAPVVTTPQGSGSGTTTYVGTATGSKTPKASGVGSTIHSGTATGSKTPKAAGTGNTVFVGTSSGEAPPNRGSASGTTVFVGSASGSKTPKATAAGTSLFSGSASGTRTSRGTATGIITFVGTASGAVPIIPPNEGSSTGDTTHVGNATGTKPLRGSATGTTVHVGTATGSKTPKASASGTTTHVGTASGAKSLRGSASGTTVHVGSASGTKIPKASGSGTTLHTSSATGSKPAKGLSSGSTTYLGTATGVRTPKGSSVGTTTFTGSASGARVSRGSASGSTVYVGEAIAGDGQYGVGSGSIIYVGSASGTRISRGLASGSTPHIGNATGTRISRGYATGTSTHIGTATGYRISRGSATGTTPHVGTATGKFTSKAIGAGTTIRVGNATGSKPQRGSAVGTSTHIGTAIGSRISVGTATALTTYFGIASGATNPIGTAVGLTEYVGSANGSDVSLVQLNAVVVVYLLPRRWASDTGSRRWDGDLDPRRWDGDIDSRHWDGLIQEQRHWKGSLI